VPAKRLDVRPVARDEPLGVTDDRPDLAGEQVDAVGVAEEVAEAEQSHEVPMALRADDGGPDGRDLGGNPPK
jgi:hypothetical protein